MNTNACSSSWPHMMPDPAELHGKTLAALLNPSGIALAIATRVQGRRSHPRFSIGTADGVLSVLREVGVRQTPTGELVAVDREPRQLGEVLTLETLVNGTLTSTLVRVVGSSPSVRNGSVFHELRLMRLP